MKYLSVCSGIEAATVAWHELGWTPWAFSEIEKFPSAVLAHYYPDIPNLGDMTKFKEWPDADIDVLVGGTPCQSFSVAGLRKGLDDPRGNLMLTYLAIADRYRPTWVVWENVPGVLSSNGGRDFGAFLGALGQLGYGWSYRVLDAQYFGVPQRRRRVFVVGHLGDWHRAAAVLFEQDSLRRNPAPSREKRQAVAALTANGVGTCGADDNQGQAGHLVAYGGNNTKGAINVATAVNACASASGRMDFESETFITGTLMNNAKAAGSATQQDAEQGMLIAFSAKDHGADATEELCPTLRAGGHNKTHANSGNWPAVAFQSWASPCNSMNPSEISPTLDKGKAEGMAVAISGRARGDDGRGYERPESISVEVAGTVDSTKQERVWAPGIAVRRLTPRECERLQGFPDDYTQIPWRNKPAEQCPDGPRYKALGNSMAVPVMRWIGERIQVVDGIRKRKTA